MVPVDMGDEEVNIQWFILFQKFVAKGPNTRTGVNDDPLATIGSFNRQFQITKKEAAAIEQAWEIEPGYTLFHVINAYTRVAQDNSLTAEEAYKLERVAVSSFDGQALNPKTIKFRRGLGLDLCPICIRGHIVKGDDSPLDFLQDEPFNLFEFMICLHK